MSSKKKLSSEEKKLRRLKEIQKAASRVDTRVMTKNSEDSSEQKPVSNVSNDNGKYTLPIKEIKKDLWKNLIFALFAIVLVVVLKVTGFGFQEVKHLLNL
jgi:hypothetical protein